MSHFAFFYFTGQAVALLFARWWLSLLVVGFIILVDLITKNTHVMVSIYWVDSLSSLFGWVSTFYVSEFVMKLQPVDFIHNAKLFKHAMLVVFQLLIFLGILTIPLLFFEPTPLLFVAILILQGLGMIPIAHIGYMVEGRIAGADVRFYIFWAILTIFTDVVFIIIFGVTDDFDVVFYSILALGVATIPLSILLWRYRLKTFSSL